MSILFHPLSCLFWGPHISFEPKKKMAGPVWYFVLTLMTSRYALAADIQTIPGLPTAPGYLNVDIDTETGEIDGLF